MAVTFKAVLASGGTKLTIVFTTSDTSLYGQTITISKNGTTVGTTAFDNTGNASYTVREAGTYDVVCGAASDQVTVQDEYPVELSAIPDGSTVTPVNDIQTWLQCAGIFNKTTYTTLADVLADTTTLLALINSNNAVDYMVRSHAWCDDVCADATAMTYIGANDYAADTLLADDNPGLVPTMTSATTPSGTVSASSEHSSADYKAWKAFDGNNSTAWYAATNTTTNSWIEYDFGDAVTVNKVKVIPGYNASTIRLKNIKIEYSDDNNNWNGGTDNVFVVPNVEQSNEFILVSGGTHRYWRMFVVDDYADTISCRTLQFYAKDGSWLESICNSTYFESVLNVKVPTMTSNTAPSGEVFNGKTGGYDPSTQDPWKSFDGDASTIGYTKALTPNQGWIGYVFTSPIVVHKVRLGNLVVSGNARCKTFIVQASSSKDGTYSNLTNDTVMNNATYTDNYAISNSNAYSAYRIFIKDCYAVTGSGMGLSIIQFYGRSAS